MAATWILTSEDLFLLQSSSGSTDPYALKMSVYCGPGDGHSSRLAALVVTALPAVSASYPPPGPCSGLCWVHDPALIQAEDGTYYRFTTHRQIGIDTASSIEGPWTPQGSVIKNRSIIDLKGNDDLWAPDIHGVDGTYYLYYTVSTFGSRNSAIGVATSPTMKEGTWTDHGTTGVSTRQGDDYNAIDANVLFDVKATYMIFGSFGTGISQVKMINPLMASDSSRHLSLAFNSTSKTGALEGSFMYKRGNYYYLFWSEGQCCGYDKHKPNPGDEYRIIVCRSDQAQAHFTDKEGRDCRREGGTEVLASHDNVYGPGGQGVHWDPKHGPVLYYHYLDKTLGYADSAKRFGWNVLDFSSGWPVVI